MANEEDHPIIATVRANYAIPEDVNRSDIYEGQALVFALRPPQERTSLIASIDEALKKDHPDYNVSMRQKAQLLGLKRHLVNADLKYRTVGR